MINCNCGTQIRNMPDYLHGAFRVQCRRCFFADVRTDKPKKAEETERVCRRCKQSLPVDQFHWQGPRRSTQCRVCTTLYTKEYKAREVAA